MIKDDNFLMELWEFIKQLMILIGVFVVIGVCWILFATLIKVLLAIFTFLLSLFLALVPVVGIILIVIFIGIFCVGYWTSWKFLDDLHIF